MDRTVVFGDVFTYRGVEYVYFAEYAEKKVIYAGKILEKSDSQMLAKIESSKNLKGKDTHKNPAFSYVVLSTQDFEKRAVICGAPYEGEDGMSALPHTTLGQQDKNAIKKEILEGPAPGALKELITLLT